VYFLKCLDCLGDVIEAYKVPGSGFNVQRSALKKDSNLSTFILNLMVRHSIEGESIETISRVLRTSEISNPKHQNTNKFQISISNDPNRFVIWNFGNCDLFVICYLRFGIFHRNEKVSLTIELDACSQWQS